MIRFPGLLRSCARPLPWVLAFAAARVAAAPRITVPITRDWTFNYFPQADADRRGCEAAAFDDAAWTAVDVPHTWSTYETTGEVHPFIRNPTEKTTPYWWNGWGWYRKHLTIDASQSGRKVFAEFDAVQKYCKIWLNGRYLGDHKGGFHSFSIDLTDAVRFGGDNVLVLAVSNRQADRFHIPVMDAGNWDLYGGIYRAVRLVITDRVYVPFQGSAAHEGGTFITTPDVSAEQAQVRVRTWVENDFAVARDADLTTTLVGPSGQTVLAFHERRTLAPGTITEFDATRRLERPERWSPESPQLYTAVSEVSAGGATDRFVSTFGIRSIRWQLAPKTGDNVLFVNEKAVNLQGFIEHQEYPWLGDAQPTWLHLADLRDMKENLGCNFFRNGHYTTDRAIYDYCDAHGMLVVEDVPNVKNKDFSRSVQEQQVREMIRRDRNRPSIFAWCMGDESDHAADSAWAHQEDPTRLIHARDCPGPSSGQYISLPSSAIRLGRLMSCTIRGWYGPDEWSFEPANHQSTSNEERQHAMGVGRATSTGGGSGSDGRIDQRNLIVWIYADHGCARTYQNEPVLNTNPKGWVDAYRFPKLAYYLWQANHVSAPMVFIHPEYWRPQYVGQRRDFIVDSNADTVELSVGRESVGVLHPSAANLHVVTFRNVLVRTGTLRATATKEGRSVTTELPMTGNPARVVLSLQHDRLEASRDTVVVVKADIVDEAGHRIYGATESVHWSVTGPATLVGPSRYTSDIHQNMALDGTMYIDMPVSNLVRATGTAGRVTVRAQCAGLADGLVSFDLVPRAVPRAGPVGQPRLTEAGRGRVRGPAAPPAVAGPYDPSEAARRVARFTADLEPLALPPRFKAELAAFADEVLVRHGDDFDLVRLKERLIAGSPGCQWVAAPGATDLAQALSKARPQFAGLSPQARSALIERVLELNPWVVRRQMITGDRKTDDQELVVTDTVPPGHSLLLPASLP